MLRITVDLFSAKDGHSETLGTAYIFNDGTGNHEVANYVGQLLKVGKRTRAKSNIWREARILDFPRTKLGVWDLLYRILVATVGNRK